MRKIYIIIILSLAAMQAWGQSPARNEGKRQESGCALIDIADSEHDFGRVAEKGKKVSYDFTFRNTGDCPLVITRVASSCKCVDAGYTKRPVPPGGEGVITVTYNPRKQQGVFRKAIQVYSNDPDEMHIVIVKGEVAAEE